MRHYIYHIEGSKVGVTTSLEHRVEKEQGYKKGEYKVLDVCDDAEMASSLERMYQIFYGYPVDRTRYCDYVKRYKTKNKSKMTVNVTNQTITFPCPLNKLKGRLMDNLGMEIETPYNGTMVVDEDAVKWITKNALTSTFRDSRCYVYNKAFEEYVNSKGNKVEEKKPESTFDLIREWARARGIYDSGDIKTQYVKLAEESGELAKAIINNDSPEIIDAIGDMVVVLTNLAHQHGVTIEQCIDSAYKEIANRKGKMQNGSFIKEGK